jgi:hypothetical protein
VPTAAFRKALERLHKGTGEEEAAAAAGIDALATHFDRAGDGKVAWLDFVCFLRVLPLEKGEDTGGAPAGGDEDDDAEDEAGPYEFSDNADLNAVELKLQKAAARSSNMGVNIPRILAAMDIASSGTILRTDFVQLLMQVDLALMSEPLHQRPMQGTGATSAESRSDVAERQLHRLQKLKDRQKQRQSVDVDAEKQLDIYAARGQTARINKKSEGLRDRNLQEREEELNMLKWYRQGRKKSLVSSLLQQSITVEIPLYPRFGHIAYFEYELTNPFSHEERFSIQCADPELRVVLDARQWQHYRSVLHPSFGEYAMRPVEVDMISPDKEISLHPGERVSVPFYFLTFAPQSAEQVLSFLPFLPSCLDLSVLSFLPCPSFLP